MNRRGFLKLLGGLVVTQAIPLNRVWSFPTQILIPDWDLVYDPIVDVGPNHFLTADVITKEVLRVLEKNLKFTEVLNRDYDREFRKLAFHDSITIRAPRRYSNQAPRRLDDRSTGLLRYLEKDDILA